MQNIRKDLWVDIGNNIFAPVRVHMGEMWSNWCQHKIWDGMYTIHYKKVPIEENDG